MKADKSAFSFAFEKYLSNIVINFIFKVIKSWYNEYEVLNMKIKRALFIVSLIVLFIICFSKMNESYDDLGRYPYSLTEEQRDIVLEQLNTEDINFLVEQKIKPEQFLPYLEVEDFILENTVWYDIAYRTQPENKEYVIAFINKYRSYMDLRTLEDVLSHYSYNELMRFFDEGDSFTEDVELITNPSDILTYVKDGQTLYHYEPDDLKSINDLPHRSIVSDNDILVRKEVVKPLHSLATAMKEINDKPFGNMEIIVTYLSVENQYELYEKAKARYGDEFIKYWDYPGRSEYQLGYSVQLMPKEKPKKDKKDDKNTKEDKKDKKNVDPTTEERREQAIWLKENAYKYGFIIRYPKEKVEVTGKKSQPYTLRYVGKELAKYMYDHDLALEEVAQSDYQK